MQAKQMNVKETAALIRSQRPDSSDRAAYSKWAAKTARAAILISNQVDGFSYTVFMDLCRYKLSDLNK